MLFRPILPLLRLVLVGAVVLFVIDLLLFRSGFYYSWIELQSTGGSVVNRILAIRHYSDPARKNILVLGNSQIGEGFSPSIADKAAGRDDLHFVNGAISATNPRVWNYLLREIDPRADRFAAIAVMVDYDVSRELLDLANYPIDTSCLMPLLRITDVIDYPTSFSDEAQRQRARRAILFPMQGLQDDILDFIRHPGKRVDDVKVFAPGWVAALATYRGHDEALPDLPIDADNGMPITRDISDPQVKLLLESYLQKLREPIVPELQQSNAAYLRLWLPRIVERYRARGVPVIVFVTPRGPWQNTLVPRQIISGEVADLVQNGDVVALPGDAFVDLEQPQYFFDELHMNHVGREKFSRRLAQLLAPLVH